MNTHERRILWDQLISAGVVNGELPQATSSPWYIRVMLGFAGWIGALFIMGFVAAGFEMVMRNSMAATVVALFFCGGAYFIFRTMPKGDFAGQFGLAIGLVGQLLFGVAIFTKFRGNQIEGYFLFLVVEGVLTLLMPNFIHRIFTTLAASGSLFICFANAGLHGLALPLLAAACVYVWRSELKLAERLDLWHPVGYGLALGLLSTAAVSLLDQKKQLWRHTVDSGWFAQNAASLETALVAAVFLVLAVSILKELEIGIYGRAGIIVISCATLIMAASFPIHGLAVALLVMVLGFSGGNRILLALGVAAFGLFMIIYYYQMQETLLYKSLMLGATGGILLVLRQGVRLLIPVQEVTDNA